MVTLAEGVEIVRVAEAVLESAAAGQTVEPCARRGLMRVVVVALGKIGLPLAAKIALAGHEVVGCDVDPPAPSSSINAGTPPFPGEAGLADALAELIPAGRLRAVTDTTAAVADGAELVIAVPPLMVDCRGPAGLPGPRRGHRRHRPRPAAGHRRQRRDDAAGAHDPRAGWRRCSRSVSGLRGEEDFFTVHSPERVYSGRIFADLDHYPKLVGGLSAEGEARAVELYRAFLTAEVWPMGSAEAAELTKLAETTYRDVNIALANEFARFADRIGVDVQRVIDAANSQPFSHIHRPGIAVGGHCIPVYPRFLLAGDPGAALPAAAREVNEAMPAYAVGLLGRRARARSAGARVLILGVTYRGAVKETAFSGAFALRDELLRQGAQPVAADPLYEAAELQELGFTPWDGGAVDAAVLQADHPQYASLTPAEVPGARVLLDGRGVVEPGPWNAAGVALLRIGAGDSPRRGAG